jgi:hypothetical protein
MGAAAAAIFGAGGGSGAAVVGVIVGGCVAACVGAVMVTKAVRWAVARGNGVALMGALPRSLHRKGFGFGGGSSGGGGGGSGGRTQLYADLQMSHMGRGLHSSTFQLNLSRF